VLFGDGFGAAIMGRGEAGQGIIFCELGSDGAGKKDLEIPWGVAQGYAAQNDANQFIVMNGREVFKNSVTYFTQIIQGALAKCNLSADEIDWIIPHQANKRIISAVAERLNVAAEKIIMTVDMHSNTSAASIPLALDEYVSTGKIKRGDKILLAGFGAGYTWGVVVFQF
jgi:3-oxoacyl-[acyl-carrier-protein] synthase-3